MIDDPALSPSNVVPRSLTHPVSRQEPPLSPLHNDAAEMASSLVGNALFSASALLAEVTHDEPLHKPDSDRESIIMGTPDADSDEDLLPSTSS